MTSRRAAFRAFCALSVPLGVVLAVSAFAQQDYPSRTIRLITPAAQGGTTDYPSAITTDRQGNLGWNPGPASADLANYAFGESGFYGTSGSAPQIAGVCALLLSANPTITWRDAQQILILSSRHLLSPPPQLSPMEWGGKRNCCYYHVYHHVY